MTMRSAGHGLGIKELLLLAEQEQAGPHPGGLRSRFRSHSNRARSVSSDSTPQRMEWRGANRAFCIGLRESAAYTQSGSVSCNAAGPSIRPRRVTGMQQICDPLGVRLTEMYH